MSEKNVPEGRSRLHPSVKEIPELRSVTKIPLDRPIYRPSHLYFLYRVTPLSEVLLIIYLAYVLFI
jgi:hypothetical protein